MIRKIVLIDEDRCDGCGQCVEACAEGAIQMIDGKAKLVSDSYCDGLGACIGECPRDAISMVEREAEGFDEEAVKRHLADLPAREVPVGPRSDCAPERLACGCPGSAVRELPGEAAAAKTPEGAGSARSRLRNWPVQLHLVPVNAPYLRGARLLLAADCVGFASPDFHASLLEGKVLVVGCPKLDDAAFYRDKLQAILQENDVRELTVAFMEIPCCYGLANLASQALAASGKDIPLSSVRIGMGGDVLEVEKKASHLHC